MTFRARGKWLSSLGEEAAPLAASSGTDDHCHHPFVVLRRGGYLADVDSLTQDDGLVRDCDGLLEVVGDEQNRRALQGKTPDQFEHVPRLADAQRGRGLVEDDDAL